MSGRARLLSALVGLAALCGVVGTTRADAVDDCYLAFCEEECRGTLSGFLDACYFCDGSNPANCESETCQGSIGECIPLEDCLQVYEQFFQLQCAGQANQRSCIQRHTDDNDLPECACPTLQAACVDECTAGTHDCDTNATCTDQDAGFTCACNAGYTGDGTSCMDVDECVMGTHSCDANATCMNTAGSFTCTCNGGYSGDGQTCTEVDECTGGTHDCDTNATCMNAPGSFTCMCNPGYAGDGQTCTDIDECTSGTHNCDVNATCTDTPGGFTCACNAGYFGTGVMCADVDECTADTDSCDANAVCTNQVGTYACACKPGFSGDGVSCIEIDEDPTGGAGCGCSNTGGNGASSWPALLFLALGMGARTLRRRPRRDPS